MTRGKENNTTTAIVRINRNTAVTTAKVLENPAVALLADAVPIGSSIFGFDPTAPGNVKMLFRTTQPATREAEQHVDEPFLLSMWCCKKIEKEHEESGEMRKVVILTLIDPEGDTLQTWSPYCLESLDIIRCLKGDGPYDPPLPVKVVVSKTKRGRNMFQLELLETM